MSIQTEEWLGRMVGQGRFLIVSALRDGGMANVFLGQDMTTGESVLVKAPRLEQVQLDPSFRQRFLREVQALKRLAHPHVVRILCNGEEEGLPFVVLRFLEGGTLGDRMYTGADGDPEPQPAEGLRAWLPMLAEALDFIHTQGYVHRDVKPHNILFDGAGNPALGDLGIARVLPANARQGRMTCIAECPVGTPPYMAPEQIHGQAVGPWTDQFALAVVVYEWLSGRRPFAGDTPEEVLGHQRQPPPPLRSFLPSLSQELSEVVARALSRKPADRFPTCQAFVSAVIASLGSAVPAAPHRPAPYRSPDKSMKTKMAAGASGGPTQLSTNPDTWSVPLSDTAAIPVVVAVVPPVATPLPPVPASDPAVIAIAPPVAERVNPVEVSFAAPAEPVGPPVVDRPPFASHNSAVRRGLKFSLMARLGKWVLVPLLLVSTTVAGSVFLPAATVRQWAGEPIASWLAPVQVPEEKGVRGDDTAPANPPGLNVARMGQIEEENRLLAERLGKMEEQTAAARKERDDANKRLAEADSKCAAESDRATKAAADSITADLKRTDAVEKLAAAEKKLTAESTRAKTAEAAMRTARENALEAARQLAVAERKLTAQAALLKVAEGKQSDAVRRAESAEEEARAAKSKSNSTSLSLDGALRSNKDLQNRLKVIDHTVQLTRLWFAVRNSTDSPVRYATRTLSFDGKWSDWEEREIDKGAIVSLSSPPGTVWVQARYEDPRPDAKKRTKTRSINAQSFSAAAKPDLRDIDCLYSFEFTRSKKELQMKWTVRKE